MDTDDSLLLQPIGDYAVLTLNRPDKRNAISHAMWRRLPELISAVEADASIKLFVVRGAGGHFAAGADIAEFEVALGSPEAARAYFDDVSRATDALQRCVKPTLAAIQGACVGGGLALALCCDLRLAAADSRFGITPARLGLSYSLADTRRLVDAVGSAAAKDILFTGRLLEAEEALRIGLVNGLAAPEAFEDALRGRAEELCAASQWTARAVKATVALVLDGERSETDATRRWQLEAVDGEDFREGRLAFTEKRAPKFTYR